MFSFSLFLSWVLCAGNAFNTTAILHHQCEHSSRWSIKVLLVFKCSCKMVCSLQLQTTRCWTVMTSFLCGSFYVLVFISPLRPILLKKELCCVDFKLCVGVQSTIIKLNSFHFAIIQPDFFPCCLCVSFFWLFLVPCAEQMATNMQFDCLPGCHSFPNCLCLYTDNIDSNKMHFKDFPKIVFNNFVELPQMIPAILLLSLVFAFTLSSNCAFGYKIIFRFEFFHLIWSECSMSWLEKWNYTILANSQAINGTYTQTQSTIHFDIVILLCILKWKPLQ